MTSSLSAQVWGFEGQRRITLDFNRYYYLSDTDGPYWTFVFSAIQQSTGNEGFVSAQLVSQHRVHGDEGYFWIYKHSDSSIGPTNGSGWHRLKIKVTQSKSFYRIDLSGDINATGYISKSEQSLVVQSMFKEPSPDSNTYWQEWLNNQNDPQYPLGVLRIGLQGDWSTVASNDDAEFSDDETPDDDEVEEDGFTELDWSEHEDDIANLSLAPVFDYSASTSLSDDVKTFVEGTFGDEAKGQNIAGWHLYLNITNMHQIVVWGLNGMEEWRLHMPNIFGFIRLIGTATFIYHSMFAFYRITLWGLGVPVKAIPGDDLDLGVGVD